MTNGFHADGTGRYRVAGPMTFETVAGLHLQSTAAIRGSSPVAIDLAAVSQVDSAGLALLIEWRREAQAAGRPLRLEHVPDALRALARLSEVEDLLA